MKFVKIYGLQRTGTNYVEWLLRENFCDVHVFEGGNVTGWKHGAPPSSIDWTGSDWDNQPVVFSIIEKYKLGIEGLETQIQHAFDNDEIVYVNCVRNPYSWTWMNPNVKDINTWNNKNRIWLEHHRCKQHSVIVRHEDLMFDYSVILDSINEVLCASKKFIQYKNMQTRIGPRMTISKDNFDTSFYCDEVYLNMISEDHKRMIRENVSKDLMKEFGFPIY